MFNSSLLDEADLQLEEKAAVSNHAKNEAVTSFGCIQDTQNALPPSAWQEPVLQTALCGLLCNLSGEYLTICNESQQEAPQHGSFRTKFRKFNRVKKYKTLTSTQ